MKSGLKVGDVVRLEGGGPPMEVTETGGKAWGETLVKCRWWSEEDGAYSEAHFDETDLVATGEEWVVPPTVKIAPR